MKIVLITPVTPTKDNINGPTAHPYHIIKGRNSDISIYIYSFNSNNLSNNEIKIVEKELNVNIKVMNKPKWIGWIIKFHLLFIRIFLTYPIGYYTKLPKWVFDEIKQLNPDGLWVYGQEMNKCIKGLNYIRVVNMLPDCESLYYYRMIGQRFVFNNYLNFIRQCIMYRKYLSMERNYITENVRYSLVGIADAKSLKNVHPGIDANFVHHPHYDIYYPQKVIKFHTPRIKVVIAGKNNLYMNQSADEFTEELCKINDIKDKYEFTYLGKGWETTVEKLKLHGYNVNHIRFAEDYKKELCNHDIQFTPICIGTGTKGKVLDALANGLLVIGTEYALENISVVNGESCLQYNCSEEAIEMLRDIIADTHKYEEMAEAGRQAVLKYHGRERVAKDFFDLFK